MNTDNIQKEYYRCEFRYIYTLSLLALFGHPIVGRNGHPVLSTLDIVFIP